MLACGVKTVEIPGKTRQSCTQHMDMDAGACLAQRTPGLVLETGSEVVTNNSTLVPIVIFG